MSKCRTTCLGGGRRRVLLASLVGANIRRIARVVAAAQWRARRVYEREHETCDVRHGVWQDCKTMKKRKPERQQTECVNASKAEKRKATVRMRYVVRRDETHAKPSDWSLQVQCNPFGSCRTIDRSIDWRRGQCETNSREWMENTNRVVAQFTLPHSNNARRCEFRQKIKIKIKNESITNQNPKSALFRSYLVTWSGSINSPVCEWKKKKTENKIECKRGGRWLVSWLVVWLIAWLVVMVLDVPSIANSSPRSRPKSLRTCNGAVARSNGFDEHIRWSRSITKSSKCDEWRRQHTRQRQDKTRD